jgi:3D-(3,5/4)-trihydroxycyclohexane-1,2-dione acylhydrolase (decyclizing)
LARAAAALKSARKPLAICGGGVLYSEAEGELLAFCEAHGLPIVETQAGKGAIADDHPLMLGALGVTGTAAANQMAAEADLILSVGSRLQDFTTGSHTLFRQANLIGLNVVACDAVKLGAASLVADARAGLTALGWAMAGGKAPEAWTRLAQDRKAAWRGKADTALAAPASASAFPSDAPPSDAPPSDAQVIGAVMRAGDASDVVVCAAGGLPGELHKLWRTREPGGYHLEYGFSCMGYEIAGGLGVKLADPAREVIVMVGDGSYLMMNSEIATSIMLGLKLIVVVLDNRGYGCINRLQRSTGSPSFNNLLRDAWQVEAPAVDFAAHAAALGAQARQVASIPALEQAFAEARKASRTQVIVIETDPLASTGEGGHWWDVAVPEVSALPGVNEARRNYEAAIKARAS